ncbi:hypothetical protein HA402_005211 [Bradysia odoriphaga]|nr:hypothetical protein HA402_005211 [Bradysia odoriphaga]
MWIRPIQRKNLANSDYLKCMCTYTLYGNIMSLQSVSLAGSQRDALLISFKDPDTFELKTLSLHHFEEDDIKMRSVTPYCYQTI